MVEGDEILPRSLHSAALRSLLRRAGGMTVGGSAEFAEKRDLKGSVGGRNLGLAQGCSCKSGGKPPHSKKGELQVGLETWDGEK